MNLEPNLISQARKNWGALALTVALGLAGGILVILQASLLSRTISRVFLEGQGLAAVSPLLFALAGVIAFRALLTFFQEQTAQQTAARIKSTLRAALYEHILGLGPAYVHGERTGELAAVAQDGIESLEAYYSQYLPQLGLAAMIPLAILLTVFPRDGLSAWVLLLTAPLIPLFMVLIGSLSQALTRRQFQALSRLSAHFLDSLQGLSTLKALGRSREHAQTVERAGKRYRQATMEVLRVTFLSALVLELVATLSTAIVAVSIGLRLLSGSLGYEEALFILILAPEFYLPLRSLGLRFHAGTAGISAAKRIFTILNTVPLPQQGQALSYPPPFAGKGWGGGLFAAQCPAGVSREDKRESFPPLPLGEGRGEGLAKSHC